MNMEAVMGVLLGIGLGAACGFRIFVPLLVAAIAIRGGFLTVTPEFAWLGGTAALVTLSVATLLEIAAYYIPVIDHTLDVLGAPAAIVAGTILAAGFIGSMDPMLKWGLAAIAGGGAAGIIHGGMAAIRGAASAATGGLGNSVVTTAETASASIVAVLACVLPVAAVLLAAAAIYFLVRTGLVLKRKLRRSPGGPEGEI
ncbi:MULTISPECIES: DUF4126 domain-containing protein [Akkermansia]|uniref:DUF4126 domain-containing protein n=1 Tax=Akkermansia massiliensis TaxID=2927224 RepID=A0ABT0RAJ9_9BACT|nr:MULTISPECIES: DUF4126 domain-containing protein [Akkermansia]MBT8785807.1 DUF4126 domain-containing protein [Akkermansia muciniphila]MBP8663781.1 DUF4126 domain-containing protein [Akkermansia sp.]MBP9525707.1 DUF4126 domain-containing protein [Akkermansia sp.]MBT9603209.1 DUF4126 domain-containing protein [Akkermansia muciniphila]MCL6657976.1 DUF4126 domain-containing protein [Akkermansia massiliensis]